MREKKFKPDSDFSLIAILSAFRDYRLCWEINTTLKIGLKRSEKDIETFYPGKNRSVFPLYEYAEPLKRLQYQLIGNKNEMGFLIPIERKADFFLRIKGANHSAQTGQALKIMKGINGITAVYAIPVKKIKSKEILHLS